MRHPHGLRAAAGNQGGELLIGAAYEGGFFAGYISHTADSVATHGLIVAPSASGYNGGAPILWKTTDTSTPGTSSEFNGSVNSANMNNASHPAAQYCEGLTIGGYSDWYMPAVYEIDIAFQNLKPSTAVNSTIWGINPYSVPERTVNRTAGAPAQTSIAAFQSGGAEAFLLQNHWTSTELIATEARIIQLINGYQGNATKTYATLIVRAFRKFAL